MTLATSTNIQRNANEGLFESCLGREAFEEYFLTAIPRPGETTADLLVRAAGQIHDRAASIVSMTVFNGRAGRQLGLAKLQQIFGSIPWPISWLESEDSPCDAPVGLEIHAIKGLALRPLRLDNRIVGCTWEDSAARYCELGDLRDEVTTHSPASQTRRVFEQMLGALGLADMGFNHIYRTWFRNQNILAWYHDFNRVRTDYYSRAGILDALLPASTGIAAANPHGAALLAGLCAMAPKSSAVRAFCVDSPLQNSACNYGSSFSRAVAVDFPEHHYLTISGTASIDSSGKTVHVGNVDAQIEWTMQVVEALLKSRHMGFSDVTRALVYFRHAGDFPLFHRWRESHAVPALPVLVTNHTVCRDDLLFEIELDAISCRPHAAGPVTSDSNRVSCR